MSGYLQGQALLNACAAGRGVIVMVEGEDAQQDPYFYNRWFGARAREVSFFPQNGWPKVVQAVADLRSQLTGRPVFGIIDRDFAEEAVLDAQAAALPADGVFRTRLSTLENYLLAPAGWLKVLKLLYRADLPPGWSKEEEVAERIADAYRQCVPLAAFNLTVQRECDRLPSGGISYKERPEAVRNPEAELQAWGAGRNPPVPLEQVYQSNLAWLQSLQPQQWAEWISGKAVMRIFLPTLPSPRSKLHSELLLNLYLNEHPEAPPELAGLVARIVDRAGQP